MEKKQIFQFGTIEKQCRVQIVETSPRSIVNVVRAQIALASAIDACKKTTKNEDGTETVSYNSFHLKDGMFAQLENDVLPILTDLVRGFES